MLALSHYCCVTPRLFDALMRRFLTLDAVFSAGRVAFLEIDGVSRRQAEQLAHVTERLGEAEAMVQSLAGRDIRLLTRFDEAYSHLLFELHDPPSLLYLRGNTIDVSGRTVAVVGTGSAGAQGIELTSRLVKELARQNIQIISSLLGGIDSAVHLAARSVDGKSFAVIDCGIDRLAQSEGVPLAIDIIQMGGIISEYPPDLAAGPKTMAESNRLIIGLAQAVVVTEVYASSERTLDLLQACRDIGKLTFLMVDHRYGALADPTSLAQAHEFGAIPIEGLDKVDDIVRSLV